MTAAAVALVVVAIAAGVFAGLYLAGRRERRRLAAERARLRSDLDGSEGRLAEAQAGLASSAAALGEAGHKVTEATGALAVAQQQLADTSSRLQGELQGAEARLSAAEAAARVAWGALDALWGIGQLEASWALRDEAAITTATLDADAGGLAGVLGEEVERVRDEAGTPGTLRVDAPDVPAGTATLVARGVHALVSPLARHCDSYALKVERSDLRVVVTVDGHGFDGSETLRADLGTLAATLALGGVIATFHSAEGMLRAVMEVPVTLAS